MGYRQIDRQEASPILFSSAAKDSGKETEKKKEKKEWLMLVKKALGFDHMHMHACWPIIVADKQAFIINIIISPAAWDKEMSIILLLN